jgi:N-acetylglucosaminyldiphosphoundecaprenol N-acetyl-beta-D-mannosaminyltransferase
MRFNAGKVLQINVTLDSKDKILEEIRKYLFEKSKIVNRKSKIPSKPWVIATPNPEQVVLAEKDACFRDILNRADITIPDGVGLIWASNQLSAFSNQKIEKRISGVDLMEKLVDLSEKESVRIALIGGRNGLAVDTLKCLQKIHPKLEGWAEDGPECEVRDGSIILKQEVGSMNYEKEGNNNPKSIHNSSFMLHNSKDYDYFNQIVKKIIDSHTQIVFVGLGAPKQEYFIDTISHWLLAINSNQIAKNQKLKANSLPILLMSVGGSFDFISGRIKRAPLLIQNIGLEWVWRLFTEPWRWKRQLALIEFVYLVLQQKLASKPACNA